MNFCLTNARHFEGNTIFLWLFLSTHYLLARKTRWLLVCDVTDDMTARHAYPRLSKVAMCVLRFGTRMSTKEIAKRQILLVFFLRENRRSASKGFFLAWLNSGKKQTRLTTRLVVFSAFSAWRHNNGFVKSLVRKIYRLPLYFPLFLKFPVCLCVYIYGVKELVFSLYTSLK